MVLPIIWTINNDCVHTWQGQAQYSSGPDTELCDVAYLEQISAGKSFLWSHMNKPRIVLVGIYDFVEGSAKRAVTLLPDNSGHDFQPSAMWSWDAYEADFSHTLVPYDRVWHRNTYAGAG